MSARPAPLVTYITDTKRVPEEELFARIGRLAVLPPDLRKRFAVQLRDPELSGVELLGLGARLREATAALGVRFFVNDRLDLALALDADGVHLGGRSVGVDDARALLGEGAFVSIACHDEREVVAAAQAGADACTLSPIFESPGKGPALGVGALDSARRGLEAAGCRAAVVALGGVSEATFEACLRAGASGVALIRAELSPDEVAMRAGR